MLHEPILVSFPHTRCTTAGDDHNMTLTQKGAVYGWGAFRSSTGIVGFISTLTVAPLPVLVYHPAAAEDQAVQIAWGPLS